MILLYIIHSASWWAASVFSFVDYINNGGKRCHIHCDTLWNQRSGAVWGDDNTSARWSLTCFVVTLHTPGAVGLTIIYSTQGLRQQWQNRSPRWVSRKGERLRKDWWGRQTPRDESDQMMPKECSQSGQVRGQVTRKQEAACREHLSLSQGQTRLREEAVSYFSFRTPHSQGSSFFNTAHMNPLRVFYDADSESGVLRWDLGFPFLANFWMVLMPLVQGSCVMQQSLRPTQKEAKQVTRKLAGVGSRGLGGSVVPSQGSLCEFNVFQLKKHTLLVAACCTIWIALQIDAVKILTPINSECDFIWK